MTDFSDIVGNILLTRRVYIGKFLRQGWVSVRRVGGRDRSTVADPALESVLNVLGIETHFLERCHGEGRSPTRPAMKYEAL